MKAWGLWNKYILMTTGQEEWWHQAKPVSVLTYTPDKLWTFPLMVNFGIKTIVWVSSTEHLPSADVWLSDSQRSDRGPGSHPPSWSRVEWVRNTHTVRSPPTHIPIQSGLVWNTEVHTKNISIVIPGTFHMHLARRALQHEAEDNTCIKLFTWQVSIDLTICAFWQESMEPARLRITHTADSSMNSDTCGGAHSHVWI